MKKNSEFRKMKAIELFAGIGGFRLAADELGIKTVWANDIDKTASEVYRHRFGSREMVTGDINTWPYPRILDTKVDVP